MKKIKNYKINISIIYLLFAFVINVFVLFFDILTNPGSIAFVIGGILGTVIGVYFGIVIPIKAMVELKTMRKK